MLHTLYKIINCVLRSIKWSWLDYSPEKWEKWSARVFLHVTISHNYLHQYNYPILSRHWWPAVPQHYSYSPPAGHKIAVWAEEVLLKDNKGCVQKWPLLSVVLIQHWLWERTVVPCVLLDKSKWHVDEWLSWVFVNNWDLDAADVREVKCEKNTIQGTLTPKRITAMVR